MSAWCRQMPHRRGPAHATSHDNWLCFYLHCSLVLLPPDAELLLRIRNRAPLTSVLAQSPVYSQHSTAKQQ